MYDGEVNFIARQHVDRFDDFVNLEEVDGDDVEMRLFAQSLSGEAKKWYKHLPARSNGGSMLKLRPREIDVPSYPTGPTLRRFTS